MARDSPVECAAASAPSILGATPNDLCQRQSQNLCARTNISASSAAESRRRSRCCISVGFNWPPIADALGNFARWRPHVRDYPVLTQGEVLAQYYGEEKARQTPGWDRVSELPVF